LKKNVALPGGPWVTPTTKEEAHDRPISGEEVVSLGLMSSEEWITVRDRALAVFNFGVAEARKRDLILVDTKYEFGLDERTGEILLIDEVHTPDSSRYWKAGSYESRIVSSTPLTVIEAQQSYRPYLISSLHTQLFCSPWERSPRI